MYSTVHTINCMGQFLVGGCFRLVQFQRLHLQTLKDGHKQFNIIVG